MKNPLVGEQRLQRPDGLRLIDAPEPVVHAVVRVGLGDGLGRGGGGQRRGGGAGLLAVDAEDRRDVRAHRLDELEPVGLGGRERLLVRDDDPLAELVEPDRGHEAAPPHLPPVGRPEDLLERVERGRRIAGGDPFPLPARPGLRGARVLVRAGPVTGPVLAHADVGDVVRAAPEQLVALLDRDQIVRRGEQLAERPTVRGREADAAEGDDLGHGRDRRPAAPAQQEPARRSITEVRAQRSGGGRRPSGQPSHVRRHRPGADQVDHLALDDHHRGGERRPSSARRRGRGPRLRAAPGRPVRPGRGRASRRVRGGRHQRASRGPGQRAGQRAPRHADPHRPGPGRDLGREVGARRQDQRERPRPEVGSRAGRRVPPARPTSSTWARSAASRGSGFPSGRSLARASRSSAAGFRARAPSP